jgi:hypothetical protein
MEKSFLLHQCGLVVSKSEVSFSFFGLRCRSLVCLVEFATRCIRFSAGSSSPLSLIAVLGPGFGFPIHKVRALACFAARACWFRCQDFDLLLWSSFRTQVLSGRRFCVRAQASSPLPKIRFPVDLRAYSSVFWPQALSLCKSWSQVQVSVFVPRAASMDFWVPVRSWSTRHRDFFQADSFCFVFS